MEYRIAYKLAKHYEQLLKPVCEKILLVGSLRRGDPLVLRKGVHDIEFLLIPRVNKVNDLFGEPQPDSMQPSSPLDNLLAILKESGTLFEPQLERKADGSKFKKLAIPGHNYFDVEGKEHEFCLELWIVTEQTWGIQAVIRTGPSTFSYCFVNSEKFVGLHQASGKRLRGLLPHYYEYIKGETKIIVRATRNPEHPELEEVLDLSTEEAAIKLLGLNVFENYWIEPSERFRYVKEEK